MDAAIPVYVSEGSVSDPATEMIQHRETLNMTTADFYILVEPRRSDRRIKEERARVATEQPFLSRPKVEAEPETLGKIKCFQSRNARVEFNRAGSDTLKTKLNSIGNKLPN